MLAPWKKSYDRPRQCIKKQRHHFADKGPCNQNYGFSSSHVWMWESDHKEGWAPKTDAFKLWCWKRLSSFLDCKENKLVNPKGSQPRILTGRTDAETEAPILWLPDRKSWLTGKDPYAEKDWGHEEKGMTEDEMIGWHYRLNGHESEQTPRQWRTGSCSTWGHKESYMTNQLNNNKIGNHLLAAISMYLSAFAGRQLTGWFPGCICFLLNPEA